MGFDTSLVAMIKKGILLITICCFKSAFGCTPSTVQHKRPGEDVTIQFQARRVNTVNSALTVTNQILSYNNSTLLTVIYTNGAVTVPPRCNGCTFTGNAATGDLSIKLTNIQAADGGTYKHSVTESSSKVKGCVTVYILGKPESPTIQADNNNVEGRNIGLTCSSKSTTNPRDRNLSLKYKWKVNNTDIPKDERYIYSQSNHTLTINNLEKQDANKRFTCKAIESGPGVTGLMSVRSNEYRINVLYGPDSSSTDLSPPGTTYTREENSNLNNITCTADCNPACNYKWTKPGNIATGSNGILSLASLNRNEAATYTCTATNPETAGNVTKTVTVIVIYGPDSNSINLNPTGITHTGNESSTLTNITCSTDCYPACSYKWTKSGIDNVISSNGVLALGTLNRNETGVYTCTATNPRKNGSDIKQVTVNVRYGPDLRTTTLSPVQSTYILEEGKILPDITCKGDCYPGCSYRWIKPENKQVASGNILSLGTLTRENATVYTCLVTNTMTSSSVSWNVTVNVIYGPDANSVTLDPKPTTYVLNEQELLADITCWADCYPYCNFKWTKSGTNNYVSSTQKLQLGTLNRNETDTYSCTATNPTSRKIAVKSIIVSVRYGPDRCEVSVPSQYNVTEGTTLQGITCQSECNPGCSYKWKNISDGTAISQTGTFLLGTVSREHAGNYKCICKNTASQYQKEENASVNIIVQYPPDVSISSTGEYLEGKPLTLTCDAKGNPSTYNYNGFIQTFGDSIIHNGRSSVNGTLRIPSLRLQDTGNYTCYVNNGVKLPSGELKDSANSTFIGVQVTPKILTDQLRFTGVTGNTTFVQVKLYSNPDIKKATVTFVRYDGLTVTDVPGSKYDIDIYKTVVEKKFYSTCVSLDGSFLNMSISNLEEDDFGNYTLVLENEIGISNATIFLDAESAPSEPKNFVYSYEDNIHKFSWFGGFNGGLSQTFVIQTSIAGLEEWVNKTTVSEKDQNQYSANISYFSPGTYTARIFAWNIEGSSKFVVLNETFTVEEENFSNGDMSTVIGGIAGGSSALIIIILGIIVVVILKRRGSFSKGKAHAHDDKNDRKPVYEDENDYGMQDNPMYVSAGPRNHEHNAGGSGIGDAGAVYSTVDKKKLVVESSKSDVYAEVDKSKKTKKNKDLTESEYSTPVKPKGKKEKKEKSNHGFIKDKKGKKMMQEGDVYENATELKDRQKKNNDEIIYENPEPSKQAEKKNVNKDGLIYADLTFNDQPKGQKKLVIHGLDSMTEYVEVDFTKKADPLPDSDDENNSPKK